MLISPSMDLTALKSLMNPFRVVSTSRACRMRWMLVTQFNGQHVLAVPPLTWDRMMRLSEE